MDDVQREKMFGQFPKQAREESRLKGGFGVDLLIGNNLVNQKEHENGENKGERISEDPLDRRSYHHGNLSTVAFQGGHRGAQEHADEEEDSRQEDHQKINADSAQHSPGFLHPEHNIEGDLQGAEDKCGKPEQTDEPYDSHNMTGLNDVRQVFRKLRIQGRGHISEISVKMIENGLVVVEICSNNRQEQHDKRNQVDEDIEGNPRSQEKAVVAIEFL